MTRIVITTSTDRLTQTASLLKKQGMRIESVLEAVGVIVGEISESKLPLLEKLPGIKVEREQNVQIPSPDEPLQ